MLRMRVIEFLSSSATHFGQGMWQAFAQEEVFGKLLEMIPQYPFNNTLHLKVYEMTTHVLDKNEEEIVEHLLDQTCLIKMILDLGKEKKAFQFEGENQNSCTYGYVAFVRKLGN